jgi:hypothetical protein
MVFSAHMAAILLTDPEIDALLGMPKRVENPGAKLRTVNKHTQRDFRVVSTDGKHEFALFVRQSTVLPDSFSAGLRWLSKSGEDVMLAIHTQTLSKDSGSVSSATSTWRRSGILPLAKRTKVLHRQHKTIKRLTERCTA